ncbi:hypothetical protein Lepto7375DRAFT_0747 [Leptolyngbya sp. PCC 7375]|nr:hypothetical protein Lepto7375DRAFT_0747 [Leptolyngbya sp. PCC 7375]
MIEQLIERLQQAGLDLTYEEIADALWLAERIDDVGTIPPTKSELEKQTNVQVQFGDSETASDLSIEDTSLPLFAADSLQQSEEIESETSDPSGLPFQAPAATALPNAIDLSRALRPLMRKVPSQTRYELDEEATVEQIAAQRLRVPIVRPELERWLDVELVVEESLMSFVWRKTIEEFQKKVLERLGAFRNLRTWRLNATNQEQLELWPYIPGRKMTIQSPNESTNNSGDTSAQPKDIKPRSLRELMHPSGRRLILLVSDCRSSLWQQRPQRSVSKESLTIYDWLEQWSRQGPTTVIQLLPERLWEQTELGYGDPVQLSALFPGLANTQLVIDDLVGWDVDGETGETVLFKPLSLPVVTLEAAPMRQWAKVVAGVGNVRTPGFWFDVGLLHQYPSSGATDVSTLSAEARVNRFFSSSASPIAKRLVRLMAAAPVSLSVVHLIQEKLLPEATPVHVAEVYMGGLLDQKTGTNSQGEPIYDFASEVRQRIIQASDPDLTFQVFTKLSEKIADEIGESLDSFDALLSPEPEWLEASGMVAPFAQVTLEVLRAMGGHYQALAEVVEEEQAIKRHRLQPDEVSTSVAPPEFQLLEFETAQIVDPDIAWPLLHQEMVTVAKIVQMPVTETVIPGLELFEYQMGQLEKQTSPGGILSRFFPPRSEDEVWVIKPQRRQGRQWVEVLTEGLSLEMVSLPAGTFMMGSQGNEEDRVSSEGPRHRVNVSDFWLGKYPVTQAQWRFVATLPQVDINMRLDPSHFKGNNRPVEKVSWYEAQEFCARLSLYTGRQYRLPTEAEWEYACRARTETPFCFGQTISSGLANYNGNFAYGVGGKGVYRGQTTPVGSFKIANGFGLYDMHGNAWEWCEDHWHNNYTEAPTDGRAWRTNKSRRSDRVLRGGSWLGNPGYCRSASRDFEIPDDRQYTITFRVSCTPK